MAWYLVKHSDSFSLHKCIPLPLIHLHGIVRSEVQDVFMALCLVKYRIPLCGVVFSKAQG
jgi:hypothetical protein